MNWEHIFSLLYRSLQETFLMVTMSTFFASILGMILGIIINNTSKHGITPNKIVHKILDIFVNIFRSIPFIILMIAIFPLSRLIVGTSIGPLAVVVPLTILTIPFVARLVSNSLSEVDSGLIEAAKVMGASNFQIVSKILLMEALPSLLNDLSVTIVNIIGASAMAGAIGGGGIGDLAIRYGYHRFETKVLIITVIAIVFIVQIVQMGSDFIVNRLRRKRGIARI